MRVHVVSDVHGRADAHGKGIFPDLFGAGAARRFIDLRTAQRFDEARQLSARLWGGLHGVPSAHVEAAASRQYEELFAALPSPSYLTYGNVDIPRLWGSHLRPGQHVLDGERAGVGGRACGVGARG